MSHLTFKSFTPTRSVGTLCYQSLTSLSFSSSFSVLKALGSASAIAFNMTMYHRSLRSFLPDKNKQKILSSLVYYLWNLCLLVPRLVALTLFASVLPCFIFTHFLCSWLILFFFVWRSKTEFMDTPGGEWLFRATVAMIWYFSWLNVAEGSTWRRTLLYHGFILADIGLLCGLWCWKMLSLEEPFFYISAPVATAVASGVIGTYIVGLALKMLYYKFFHPNIGREDLNGSGEEGSREKPQPLMTMAMKQCEDGDEERDGQIPFRSHTLTEDSPARQTEPRCNKRMRQLAGNFYCNT